MVDNMKSLGIRILNIVLCLGLIGLPAAVLGQEEDNNQPEAVLIGAMDQSQITVNSVLSGDYWYEDISGGIKITAYSGSGGNVDIPASLDGKTVLEIASDAFNGNNALMGVNLPSTVTTLGLRAFYNCPNLKSVFLGNGLTTIGNGSFWGATSLNSIIVPASVTTIGYAAFSNCTELNKITILNNTVNFGAQVFGTIPNLTIYGYTGSTADSYAYANLRPFVALPPSYVDVYYSTHVQNVGWQAVRENGEISGTVGQGLRLEGIKILIDNSEVNAVIQYQTHIQNIGWQAMVSNGSLSGTTGQSLRLEGIRIELDGVDWNLYDVYYRVHAQNFGWLDWAKNGADAGTEGMGLRLEGIQIMVVAKNSAAPGATDFPFQSSLN
ncbi:MAG: hypothetical protein PWP16_1914 [Eubacteriaceae bacterium]|nr:hypothetical protein [Eubacteriaceae bacterium]